MSDCCLVLCTCNGHKYYILSLVYLVDVKSYLIQQLDVFISVREKPRQSCISVIVKSIEQNAHCVYQARDQLLQALTKGEVDGKISPVRFDGSVSWRDPDDGSAGFEESFNAVSHFSQSQRKQENLNHSQIQSSAAAVTPSTRETVSSGYSQVQKQPSSQVHPVMNPFADYTEKKQKATKGMHVHICTCIILVIFLFIFSYTAQGDV